MAHVRKFWLLPEVSESTAVLSHNLAYAGLIVGAALVFIGTLVLFWADAEIKRHGDARLSANEVETGRAKESAGLANKAAGEANQRAGEANERAAELERQAQELRAKNLLFEAALQPRTLEQSMSVKALRQFAGTEVRVVSPDETEPRRTAGQIRAVVRDAGWPKYTGELKSPLVFFPGVVVHASIEKREAADALVAQLLANDITARRGFPLDENAVLVIVGPKPLPPALEPTRGPDERGNRVYGNVLEDE